MGLSTIQEIMRIKRTWERIISPPCSANLDQPRLLMNPVWLINLRAELPKEYQQPRIWLRRINSAIKPGLRQKPHISSEQPPFNRSKNLSDESQVKGKRSPKLRRDNLESPLLSNSLNSMALSNSIRTQQGLVARQRRESKRTHRTQLTKWLSQQPKRECPLQGTWRVESSGVTQASILPQNQMSKSSSQPESQSSSKSETTRICSWQLRMGHSK